MFIFSIKAQTVKLASALILSASALVLLLALIPTYEKVTDDALNASAFPDGEKISFTGIKEKSDIVAFLSQFGWTVNEEPKEEKEITIPAEFDSVMEDYNRIQTSQGLNLEKYKRKKVMKYVFSVTNYPDFSGSVNATVLVYRGKVIGGDISSADIAGFKHGFSA